MFGSIGHAAGDTESLSQRSSGHINEVQPDEDILVVDAVYPLSAKLYNNINNDSDSANRKCEKGETYLARIVLHLPWGRMSLQVGVDLAKVHQLRGREKTSLIQLD